MCSLQRCHFNFSLHSVPENTHFILDSILTLFGGGGNKTRESKEKKKVQKEKKSESGIDPQNGFSRGHRAERGGKHTKKSDSNQATINFALIEQLHSLGSMIVGSVGDGGGSLGIAREWGRNIHCTCQNCSDSLLQRWWIQLWRFVRRKREYVPLENKFERLFSVTKSFKLTIWMVFSMDEEWKMTSCKKYVQWCRSLL